MVYPYNIEKKLGFDKIKDFVKKECLSTLGGEWVERMSFVEDYTYIQKQVNSTEEFQKILEKDTLFPLSSHFYDIRPYLDKAVPEASMLTNNELHEIRFSLTKAFDCLTFLIKRKELYPYLYSLTKIVSLDKKLLSEIDAVIDEKGEIKDHATKDLKQIRNEVKRVKRKIRDNLSAVMQQAISNGFSDEKALPTIRGGRMVIPLKATYKKRIKGFIHDESATGQTVYLEPSGVLNENNRLIELKHKERRACIQILRKLTDLIRPAVPLLKELCSFLAQIDFLRAKAKFAISISAVKPVMLDTPGIKWFDARHPLLLLLHISQKSDIVPLDILLDQSQRIVLISGPNAGGKSVCLKTVGLLQYMFQSGMLVPVAPHSQFGIFKKLFIDIGDEQSIENDLSTYSSHLNNMKFFLENASSQTLFLIDEYGTGTDPQFGGAIAEAILEELDSHKPFGIITTHYGSLKNFAAQVNGIVNAAMVFDVKHHRPLYQLVIGKPGSSFTFEIAREIGISEHTISRAREKANHTEVSYDQMLNELLLEKKKYAEKYQLFADKEKELEKAISTYTDLHKKLEKQKKEAIHEAREEARQLVDQANKKIERTIEEIVTHRAQKEPTRKARKILKDFKEQLLNVPEVADKKDTVSSQGKISEGDWVKLQEKNLLGKVLKIKKQTIELAVGDLITKVAINQVAPATAEDIGNIPRRHPGLSGGFDMQEKRQFFSPVLDVRGKRAHEVLDRVDRFIDDGLVLGYQHLKIIHGKGDGVLRKVIRTHIKKSVHIHDFYDEHIEKGGSGITIVELK